ncbi:MAG: RNB domain-containing ribonuclease [Turneriella sp.]
MDKQTEKLVDKWLFHAYKSGDLSVPIAGGEKTAQRPHEGGKKQKPQHRIPGGDHGSAEAFRFLKVAGLVEEHKKKWLIRNRFTGILSSAKSGLAFVPAGVHGEAIIPHGERGAALHRDKVEICITGYGRGRFTAKVMRIVEPFSGEYLARVVSLTRGQDMTVVELIDLPDRPHVLYKGKAKTDELIYLKRTGEQQQHLRHNARAGGYNRVQTLVFEASHRKVTQDRKGDMQRLKLRFMLPEEFEKSLIPQKKHLTALVKKEMKNPLRSRVKDRYIFTIDGDDAKDFDDAISCHETSTGFELDVHIADVGFFVRPGTELFEEALKRGNSYYLAGGVIPMLPEILSNEFCSLKPKTDRLAFSVRMNFDRSGTMLSYDVFKSVIYIDKRYTYKEAHKDLAKKKSPLRTAMQLAEILIARRDSEGRIDLNIAEQKAIYDKHGRFVTLESQQRLNSHRLIEECMLSANQAVANFSISRNIPILHRNHESMPLDKIDRLNRYLEKYAARLKIRGADQREIGRVLAHQALNSVRDVFQYLLLRSFMQANYTPESKGHWGLAFVEYAHFTSPIRRFADLVTHLQIAAYLGRERNNFSAGDLEFYGREASRLERIAFEAERTDKKMLAVRAMAGKTGQVFSAWLSGFTSERLFVNLADFPVEGEIDAAQVDKHGEVQIIDDFTIFAGKLQKSLALGDRFKVRLVKADPVEMALKFEFSRSN